MVKLKTTINVKDINKAVALKIILFFLVVFSAMLVSMWVFGIAQQTERDNSGITVEKAKPSDSIPIKNITDLVPEDIISDYSTLISWMFQVFPLVFGAFLMFKLFRWFDD